MGSILSRALGAYCARERGFPHLQANSAIAWEVPLSHAFPGVPGEAPAIVDSSADSADLPEASARPTAKASVGDRCFLGHHPCSFPLRHRPARLKARQALQNDDRFSWNPQVSVCCFEQPMPLLILECVFIVGESHFLPSQ
jgi:hypothetical protein